MLTSCSDKGIFLSFILCTPADAESSSKPAARTREYFMIAADKGQRIVIGFKRPTEVCLRAVVRWPGVEVTKERYLRLDEEIDKEEGCCGMTKLAVGPVQ